MPPTVPDLQPLLSERWSPRVFDPAHVLGDGELRQLLTAAQWAPSAGNLQPWAFLVGRRGDETHARLLPHLSRGNAPWVPHASAVLISAHRVAPDPGEEATRWSGYALHDLGQAVAHLCLQAAALGLHTHQFAGFDHDAVAAAFGVPPQWQVTAGLAVGRAGDQATAAVPERDRAARVRRPLAEIAFAGAWGAPAGTTARVQ